MASQKIEIARQITAEKILDILKGQEVYGFIEHNAIKAPDRRIEYIGMNSDYEVPLKVTMGGGYYPGDWAGFKWLKANKPYMVRADGSPDYRLNENDYTKKEDGSVSDVSNADYNGGAFSWAMRLYTREYMVGDDRYRLFAYDPLDGFEPVGFVDPTNNVLEGVWIPMFYGAIIGNKMRSIAGNQPCYSKNTQQEHEAIAAFSDRAVFFGGPIIQVLTDLLIMFAKTTDLQQAYGYGNCEGYDASQAPANGVKRNAVVGGGQFYGTDDRKSLNKIFHSIVLGSYQQWIRDPYEIVKNGGVKVSKNYAYDPTGGTFLNTGFHVANRTEVIDYPGYYTTVPGYGSVPAHGFNGGSTATGGCDGLYRSDYQESLLATCVRFGSCDRGLTAGPRARAWDTPADHASWHITAAELLLPPAGVTI